MKKRRFRSWVCGSARTRYSGGHAEARPKNRFTTSIVSLGYIVKNSMLFLMTHLGRVRQRNKSFHACKKQMELLEAYFRGRNVEKK